MAVLITVIAPVTDWTSMQSWHAALWADLAATLGATACRLYRNIHDGTQMLMVIELPEREVVWAVTALLDAGGLPLRPGGPLEDLTWEPVA